MRPGCRSDEENSLLFSSGDMVAGLEKLGIDPESRFGSAETMNIGAMLGISSPGEALADNVKTEDQLNRVLSALQTQGRKIPSLLRKLYKNASSQLPRTGGPGRKRRLGDEEIALLLDHVARLIREGRKTKRAIIETSKLSPDLLDGKQIGARTLQTYWSQRGKLAGRTNIDREILG